MHYFLIVGRKIIKSCREIICLTPKKDLPEIKNKLKELKYFLTKNEPGKKEELHQIGCALLNAIAGTGHDSSSDYIQCSEQLSKYYVDLDELMEQELPPLSES